MTKLPLILTVLFLGVNLTAATLPEIHNGSPPLSLPTKVLDCNLPITPMPNSLSAFSSCIENTVQDYGEERVGELQDEINLILPLEIKTCLAGLNTSVVTSFNQARSNPTNFVSNRVNTIRESIAENADQLFNVSLSNPETSQQRVVRFRQALLDGMRDDPVANCMVDISPAVLAQLTNLAEEQAAILQQRMEALYREHFEAKVYQLVNSELIPALQGLKLGLAQRVEQQTAQGARRAGQLVMNAASTVPIPQDIELMALGLLVERALDPARLTTLAQSIELYARTASPTAQQKVNLQRKLNSVQSLTDDMAVTLGIRVVRRYTHDVIDEYGDPTVEFAFEYVRGYKTVLYEVVDVPCSTGVYVSEGVCSVVQGVVGIIVDFALSGLHQATMTAMHAGADRMIDAHYAALQGGTPVQRARESRLLQPVARHLPTADELLLLLIPKVRAMASGMQAYHKAVATLAEVHGSSAPSFRRPTSRLAPRQ